MQPSLLLEQRGTLFHLDSYEIIVKKLRELHPNLDDSILAAFALDFFKSIRN